MLIARSFFLVLMMIIISQGCKNDRETNVSVPTNPSTGSSTSSTPSGQQSSSTTKVGTPSFAVQYHGELVVKKVDYHFVDGFGFPATDIVKIKNQGAKAFCYFSSQYEDWRPDAKDFPKKDIGKGLDGWKGESWVNVKSDAIKAIMLKRFDLAKSKGCDGVDLDNVDFYTHDSGFKFSINDGIEYVTFLCSEAHKRGMLFNLKNGLKMIKSLEACVDTFQNEECMDYDECDYYDDVSKKKPVFGITYKSSCKTYPGIYMIYKKKMDGWSQACQ